MNRVVLGSAGVSVSELCLGTMHLGTNTPEDVSLRILDAFVEKGGSFLDTANIYNSDAPGGSGGESERIIGRWMKDRQNRSAMFVATKVGLPYPDQPRGLNAAQIAKECERSLQRLGVDVIDLYYAHIDDRQVPFEESLEAFDQLVRAGKVRFLGASNYQPTRLVEALWTSERHGWAPFCCIQNRYSYLRPAPGTTFGHQVAANDDVVDFCARRRFPLIGFAPFLKGAIAPGREAKLRDQYKGEDSRVRLGLLHQVASETGMTVPQVVLAWMRHHDAPIIPLIGVTSVDQLDESTAALERRLDAECFERLNACRPAPAGT